MQVNVKTIGGLIITAALVFLFILVSFINTLSDMTHESCTCGDSCSMKYFELPLIFYIGLLGVIMLLVIGILLFFKTEGLGNDEKNWEQTLKGLEADEKIIYKAIMDSEGALFQSELVEKTGLTKVKVTRLLDKLESKNKLERRRRGLTNIVVLK